MTESLKQRLRAALNTNDNNKMSKLDEDELFKKEYLDMKGHNLPREDKSYKVIPQFYKSLPTEDDVLQQKLREEARAQFLQRRSKLLLDNAELKVRRPRLHSSVHKTNVLGALGGAGQPHQRPAPGRGADDGLGPVLCGQEPRQRQVPGVLQVFFSDLLLALTEYQGVTICLSRVKCCLLWSTLEHSSF